MARIFRLGGVSMTESEVIERLQRLKIGFSTNSANEILDVAIKALENQEKIKEAFEKWQADTSGFYGADNETGILICTLKRILRSDEK